ncbi:MAG: hypothetical protein DRO10_01695 [Thermoprotei archaeon]|nr:MAG: hypothetical protein DRO10_01695 [Thermoprotei archaeon]
MPRIRYLGWLKEAVGINEEFLPGSIKVSDILSRILSNKALKAPRNVTVLLNGKSLSDEEVKSAVAKDQDIVELLPVVSGG